MCFSTHQKTHEKINSKFTRTSPLQTQPTCEINTTQKATHTTRSTKGPLQIKPTTTNPSQPNINPLQITVGRDPLQGEPHSKASHTTRQDPRGQGRTLMQADLDPRGQI